MVRKRICCDDYVARGGLTFLFGQNLRDVKESVLSEAKERNDQLEKKVSQFEQQIDRKFADLEEQLPYLVAKTAEDQSSQAAENITKLNKKSESLKTRLGELVEYADAATSQIETVVGSDPFLDYSFATEVSEEPVRPDDPGYKLRRLEANSRLTKVLEVGLKGECDTNLLFNSAMTASKLELEDLAIKLWTICAHLSPSPSHTMALYRGQMTIGRRYEVKLDSESYFSLRVDDRTSATIISDTFDAALVEATTKALPQCEIIYSECWNMAQKCREDGGYQRLLDTLTAVHDARSGVQVSKSNFGHSSDWDLLSEKFDAQRDVPVPSDLCGKISALHAMIGTSGWRSSYEKFLKQGMLLAADESDVTTWKNSFLHDAAKMAALTDTTDLFKRLADEAGISTKHIENASQKAQADDLLKGLAELVRASS